MRILFCGDTFPAASSTLRKRLLETGDEIMAAHGEDLKAAASGACVLIPLMSRIDTGLMDAGPVRLIQQWGAGIEGVDLAAARERGIQVANVPALGGNADSVAEHAILLIIALLRELPAAQESVRTGRLGSPQGRTLAGRTVCLYGLGAIAKALVRRLRPFDVRLVGITRDPQAAKVAELGLDDCFSIEQRTAGLAQSDVLVLCTSLSNETHGMIDESALGALPKGAYLVNIARGPLIRYDALHAALQSGHGRRGVGRVLEGTDRTGRSATRTIKRHRYAACGGRHRPVLRGHRRCGRSEYRAPAAGRAPAECGAVGAKVLEPQTRRQVEIMTARCFIGSARL